MTDTTDDGLKVTLVLDPADADFLARCADGHAGSLGKDDRARARELADRIRKARRHRHGRRSR